MDWLIIHSSLVPFEIAWDNWDLSYHFRWTKVSHRYCIISSRLGSMSDMSLVSLKADSRQESGFQNILKIISETRGLKGKPRNCSHTALENKLGKEVTSSSERINSLQNFCIAFELYSRLWVLYRLVTIKSQTQWSGSCAVKAIILCASQTFL